MPLVQVRNVSSETIAALDLWARSQRLSRQQALLNLLLEVARPYEETLENAARQVANKHAEEVQ